LSALLLVAFAVAYSWEAWESEKAAQLRQLSEVAELGARSLNSHFRHLEMELQVLSLDLNDGQGRIDPDKAHPLLLRFGKYHPDFRDVAIVGVNGRMLASAPALARAPLPGAAELPGSSQLREALLKGQRLGIGRAVPGRTDKEWLIPLAYASRDAQGKLRHLIYASVPLAQWQSFWEGAALVQGRTLGLQLDDGYPMSRHPLAAKAGLEQAHAAPGGDALAEAEQLSVSRRLADYPLSFHASMPVSNLHAAWWARMRYPYLLLALLLAGGALAYRWAQKRQSAWEAERERGERETRELNRELARRVEELEATKLEIESFSYCVAHDLRTPVRGIDGFAYQLRKDYGEQLGASGRAYLDRIRAASQQLGVTMDELHKLSETELHAFKREVVDLSALAREVVAGLETNGHRNGLEWVIAEGIRAEGDIRLLRLVLHNLLDNALKFTRGHAAARIEFGLWPELREGKPVYFVKDDGVGFDMKDAGKLFRAFERLHPKEEFPGHGVGLAVVQRIIRRHRGQIWAEAAPRQGAIFYFALA